MPIREKNVVIFSYILTENNISTVFVSDCKKDNFPLRRKKDKNKLPKFDKCLISITCKNEKKNSEIDTIQLSCSLPTDLKLQ